MQLSKHLNGGLLPQDVALFLKRRFSFSQPYCRCRVRHAALMTTALVIDDQPIVLDGCRRASLRTRGLEL
jgi:hypothetical protein